MINLHERMLPTRQGSNLQPHGHQWDMDSTEPLRSAYFPNITMSPQHLTKPDLYIETLMMNEAYMHIEIIHNVTASHSRVSNYFITTTILFHKLFLFGIILCESFGLGKLSCHTTVTSCSSFFPMKHAVRFICVGVLQPIQPIGVMSSTGSLPNHTFTGQA